MKLQNVFFLLTLPFVLLTISVAAQEPTLRIYGVGYGEGSRRTEGSDLISVPVTMSEDGRHARFRLVVSVRNYGTASASYKLQVIAGRARAGVSPLLEVGKGTTRREAYDVDLAFGDGSPSTVFVLPPNPVRADLVLFDGDGRELGRRGFNLILSFSRTGADRRTLRTDLMVESARLVYTPAREFRVGRTEARVQAFMTIRNVGSETWGFRGNASLHLQQGTPETRLDDIGAPGMPTDKILALPTGLSPHAVNTLSAVLETRLRNTTRIGSTILRVSPPLRPGVWYTLTASTSSEADLDPSNDAVQFVFMLNDDMTIRESRMVRMTTRVRVLTR